MDLVGRCGTVLQDSLDRGVVALQLPGYLRELGRPRLDRVCSIGLAVQDRGDVVGDVGQRIEVGVGVDRQCGGALDESGDVGTEPAEGGVGLVDDGLEVVGGDGA